LENAAHVRGWGGYQRRDPYPVIDALLASTAKVHDLVLVTRNTPDVSGLGVRTLNPFDERQA